MERDIGLFFKNFDDKGIAVSFGESTILKEGLREGTISRTRVSINHGGTNRDVGNMILKELRSNVTDYYFPECSRGSILKKYLLLKKIGLPVPPTFRVDTSERRYLMTDLTGISGMNIFDRHNPCPVGTIKNLGEIKTIFRDMATLAYRNNVYLSEDAYCLLFDRTTKESKPFILDIGIGSCYFDSQSTTGLRPEEISAVEEVDYFFRETFNY